jgi:predicted amidohydrolase
MAALQVAVQAAAAAGSDMVVCPELYATGYTASAVLHAEPRHGPSYTAAQRFARESNISLLFTYAEEGSDGAKYDAAALFYRTGATLADYRKVNLAAGEAAFLTPGTAFAPVVVVDGVRVGVMICFDIFLPEPARLLALQKVDLLLVPTANGYPPSVYNQLTQLIVPTRGLENNAFVVYNNWCVDMPRPWPWPPPSTATAHQLSHRPCTHSMRVGHVAGTVRGTPALTPTTVSATRSESDSQVPGLNPIHSSFPEPFTFYGQSVVADPSGTLIYQAPGDRGILSHVFLNYSGHVTGSTALGRQAADVHGLCGNGTAANERHAAN